MNFGIIFLERDLAARAQTWPAEVYEIQHKIEKFG